MAAAVDLRPRRAVPASGGSSPSRLAWTCREVQDSACFDGMAVFQGKLYLCPHNATCVVVIDPRKKNEITRVALPIGLGGRGAWRGMAAAAGRLFCAPSNASEVLVVDPSLEPPGLHAIAGGRGDCNWDGLCVCNGELYCAPFNAHSCLVINPRTEAMRTVRCDAAAVGPGKWSGAAAALGKVFACPHNAGVVLVVDPRRGDEVSTIDCGYVGNRKWSGIARHRAISLTRSGYVQ